MLCALNVMPAAAEEPTTTDSSHLDCRYEGIGKARADSPGSSRTEVFPEADVFRPLLADPKQPQFFAGYQAMKVRDTNQSVSLGSVGFGENFGLVGKRNGCDGWQVGILAGVFAQFDLGSSSMDLINADYVVAFLSHGGAGSSRPVCGCIIRAATWAMSFYWAIPASNVWT